MWTASGLTRFAVLFVIDLATRRVEIAGIHREPDSAWVVPCVRQLTDPDDGCLRGKRFLHDCGRRFGRRKAAQGPLETGAASSIQLLDTTRLRPPLPMRWPATTGSGLQTISGPIGAGSTLRDISGVEPRTVAADAKPRRGVARSRARPPWARRRPARGRRAAAGRPTVDRGGESGGSR